MAFSMTAPGVPFLAHAAHVSVHNVIPPPYKRMRLTDVMGSGGLAEYGKLLGSHRVAVAVRGGYGVPAVGEAKGPRCGDEGRVAALAELAGRAVCRDTAPPLATAAAFGTTAPAEQPPPVRGGASAGEMMVEGGGPHAGGGPQRDMAMHHRSPDWPELPEPQMQRPAPLGPGAANSGGQRSADGGRCTAIVPFFGLPGAICRPGGLAALGGRGFEGAAPHGEAPSICRPGEATVEEIVLELAGEECAADSMDCS